MDGAAHGRNTDGRAHVGQQVVIAAAARHGKAWGRPSGSTEDIAHLAKKGARLIAHGSDFGAVMRMMPVFAKTMKDGLGEA